MNDLNIKWSMFSIISGKKKLQESYMKKFEEQYNEVHNIKKTLEIIAPDFKKKRKLHCKIEQANYYLDYSILKDYKTALNFINNVYPNLKEFHDIYIEKAKEQQRFMLVDKGGN